MRFFEQNIKKRIHLDFGEFDVVIILVENLGRKHFKELDYITYLIFKDFGK
ncbi:MAG: hypothetical protein ACXAAI_15300 [Promethearchaeota archaeon]|jgi:hypothetical protein